MAWTKDDLSRIADADDLHVSPFRDDGVTHGTPTWIWSVVVDGELYVRAYNGRTSRWYRAALKQKAGRVSVGGKTYDVRFEAAGDDLADRIDDAYRAKYATSPYLGSMISARARSATVQIRCRTAQSEGGTNRSAPDH